MGQPENEVQKSCLQLLHARGIFCWRQNNQGRYLPGKGKWIKTAGILGQGDIIGVYPGGTFISVECKAGQGRASEAQQAFMAQVKRYGGLAVCVWSAKELEDWLNKL
jgi:hypothetical protein